MGTGVSNLKKSVASKNCQNAVQNKTAKKHKQNPRLQKDDFIDITNNAKPSRLDVYQNNSNVSQRLSRRPQLWQKIGNSHALPQTNVNIHTPRYTRSGARYIPRKYSENPFIVKPVPPNQFTRYNRVGLGRNLALELNKSNRIYNLGLKMANTNNDDKQLLTDCSFRTGSLSSLNDAHLRRCSVAQYLYLANNNNDKLSDSYSVDMVIGGDNGSKISNGGACAGSQIRQRSRMLLQPPGNALTNYKFNSARKEQLRRTNRYCSELEKPTVENSGISLIDMSLAELDARPLHYVFYVHETTLHSLLNVPVSGQVTSKRSRYLKNNNTVATGFYNPLSFLQKPHDAKLPIPPPLFSRGHAVYRLAKQSGCRVYFGSLAGYDLASGTQSPVTMSDTGSNNEPVHAAGDESQESIDIMAKGEHVQQLSPELFFRRQRVMPITVAASDMASLRRFLCRLDTRFPELSSATRLLATENPINLNEEEDQLPMFQQQQKAVSFRM